MPRAQIPVKKVYVKAIILTFPFAHVFPLPISVPMSEGSPFNLLGVWEFIIRKMRFIIKLLQWNCKLLNWYMLFVIQICWWYLIIRYMYIICNPIMTVEMLFVRCNICVVKLLLRNIVHYLIWNTRIWIIVKLLIFHDNFIVDLVQFFKFPLKISD